MLGIAFVGALHHQKHHPYILPVGFPCQCFLTKDAKSICVGHGSVFDTSTKVHLLVNVVSRGGAEVKSQEGLDG